MIGMATALNNWLSNFGTFYAEGDVPDDAALPYGVVPLKDTYWQEPTTFYIKWYARTNDSTVVLSKADQIAAAIGEYVYIPYTGGLLVIYPETPLIQVEIDGDIRWAYINLSIRSYHMPGV